MPLRLLALAEQRVAALEPQPRVEVELHCPNGHARAHGALDAGDALVAEAGAQLHGGDALGGQLLGGGLRLGVIFAAHHVQIDAGGGYHGAGVLIGVPDEEDELSELMRTKYPKEYACSRKIAEYIEKNTDCRLSGEEVMYLAIHIRRVTMAED